MPIQFPDGVYDRTHTWQNANDRVEYERTVSQDPIETAKIMAALELADPSTPNAEIQEAMTVSWTPPTQGYDRTPLTVADCFGGKPGAHTDDYAPSNFSGRKGEFQGSSVPSMPAW
jgi:hypothetical protein